MFAPEEQMKQAEGVLHEYGMHRLVEDQGTWRRHIVVSEDSSRAI
jgi:hypothetical protein